MKSPLYDSVNRLAIEIVNASAAEDEKTLEKGYDELRKLCFKNENTEKDHPLQWEALGDFSASNTDSIASYEKGLIAARNLHLPEYEASILFAMAEANLDEGDLHSAVQFASEASQISHKDTELAEVIYGFVKELGTA